MEGCENQAIVNFCFEKRVCWEVSRFPQLETLYIPHWGLCLVRCLGLWVSQLRVCQLWLKRHSCGSWSWQRLFLTFGLKESHCECFVVSAKLILAFLGYLFSSLTYPADLRQIPTVILTVLSRSWGSLDRGHRWKSLWTVLFWEGCAEHWDSGDLSTCRSILASVCGH